MEAGGLDTAAGEGLIPMPLVRHHGVLPRVHASAFVAPGAQLVGEVLVGEDSSVWFNAVLRGDIHRIVVGARTNIQDGSVVHVTSELPALIGSDVTVGHMAMIHGCRIEDACLIGMNAIVLDGAVVGPGALVAAGSVVREGFVVPPGMLVAGVPARVVRELTESERREILQSAAHYVEYARSFQEPRQGEETP
jgi:carbonic anhydrase/acetyltransferase-like protein (isoleucine patch superfamily)